MLLQLGVLRRRNGGISSRGDQRFGGVNFRFSGFLVAARLGFLLYRLHFLHEFVDVLSGKRHHLLLQGSGLDCGAVQ